MKEWNIQDHLKTPEDLANFLESALEENDYEFLKIAVGDVIAALRRKELLKNLELFSGKVYIAYCPICENYLKATALEQKD